jgi:murein DD-endopeptidase MepM/ murein hydrolase activator NlpD
MSKYQQPIDGAYGKTWKITSKMGWRIHPVKKTRKHHNGTDICGLGRAPWYVEAFAGGTVLKARVSDAAGGGFGHYVVIRHMIDGEYYTSLYAHLEPGSIQVKPGQKVKPGTVLGKMGTSGMSTGIHLHWEIWKGKTHGWSADGKGFVEPISFVKALTAAEKAKAYANVATDEKEPTAPAPVHEPAKKKKINPYGVARKMPVGAPKKPAAKKVDKPAPKVYTVKSGDTLGKIARANKTTISALSKLNGIKNPNLIRVGQKIKLS